MYSFQYVQRALPIDREAEFAQSVERPLLSSYVVGRMRISDAGPRETGDGFAISGEVSYQVVSGPFGQGMDAALAVRQSHARFTASSAMDGGGVECELFPIEGKDFVYSPTVVAGLNSVFYAFADVNAVEIKSIQLTREEVGLGVEHVSVEVQSEREGYSMASGWLRDRKGIFQYYKNIDGIMNILDVRYSHESNLVFRRVEK